MTLRRALLAAVALSSGALLPTASAGAVQRLGLTLPPSAVANRAAVVQIFNETYDTYKKYADGHDDLQPVSLTFNDGRNGWGATIVDAMSTMVIMGLDDKFAEAVEFAGKIDFSKSQTSSTVSVFETTIRYVGGLLSAFELSGSQYPVLVQKAKEVADKLVYAWTDNHDVPFGQVDFIANTPVIQNSNIAEAGTLTLEFSTLSKLTNNDTYRQLAERSARHIISLPDPLPGLPAQGIDPGTGNSVGGYVTWGGGSDSYFEYLIKYPRLNLTADPAYAQAWMTAVDSSIRFLARTSTVGNYQYIADLNDDGEILDVGSHLECFHGGNWLLGGQLLNNQTIIDFALKLVDACWNTYQSTATGIGPETFAFISTDASDNNGGSTPSSADKQFYDAHGFYVTNSQYILRPEVLESNFYAWRVTGDTKYQDRAASAISSFNNYLKVNNAFAGITDVGQTASGKIDDTQSFFFAEVLKYLYLTFDDPDHISLDNYVFNTEAHPFAAPPQTQDFASRFSSLPPPPPTPRPFSVTAGSLPVVSPISMLVKQVSQSLHDGGL